MSRPTNAKVSAKLTYPSNNQFTSFGEIQKVRYKTLAQTWSKNGFSLQIKGVSPTCLLSGLQIVQPLDVRWCQHDASNANAEVCAAAAPCMIPNSYPGFSDVTAAANVPAGMADVRLFDNICIRPNALMRAARSCVLSYNGRSFSTRVKQYLSGVERVFQDGSVEEIYGWPHSTYPFSNVGDPTRLLNEPGRLQRCKELTSDVYLKGAHYEADHQISDLIMSYNIRSRLFLGPFVADAFPGMMQSLDENSGGSLPYLSNLSIEIQYETNPLQHFFAYPANDISNCLAVNNPKGFAMTDAGTNVPDLALMWATVVEDNNGLTEDADTGRCVALKTPYCEYEFVEPSPLMQIPQQLTIASKNFVTYEDVQQIQAGAANKTVKFSFSNIKLNSISQLYMLWVEAADTTLGTAIGARQTKFNAAGQGSAADVQRLGGAYSVVFAPWDWSSVRCLLSTRNQVLGNFDGRKLGITEYSMYKNFLKYSSNRCKMSLAQWRQSSQMLLFSAEDLNLDKFGGQAEPLSLTIEFETRRLPTDEGVPTRAFARASNFANAPVNGVNYDQRTHTTNLVARLCMIQQEQITIFDGGCEKQSVYWDQSTAEAAARASLQSGQAHANKAPEGTLSGAGF